MNTLHFLMTKYHIRQINLSDTRTIFDIVTYIHSVINTIWI
jgi:hypothetical protein